MRKMNRNEIETEISNVMRRFLHEQLGEPVGEISTELNRGTIMVRLKNVLSPAEKNLARVEGGKKMIKEFKEKLIERSRPLLESMVKNLTGAEIVDIHSSFNPDSAERVEIFILSKNTDDLFNSSIDT